MIRTKMKTKLTLGLLSLFFIIICFGILGIFYVNRLSSDAGMILKDNYISVEYCNKMLKALEEVPEDPSHILVIKKYLDLEETNITEQGELEATSHVRSLLLQMEKDPANFTAFKALRLGILRIEDINQEAIVHKNIIATNTAKQATLWLTVIVSFLSLIAFTFVVNFPAIISKPVRLLTEGIEEIANKNYSKRIHLEQQDEFGALADTFNAMAEKLDEYEHSNLAEIKFEKSRIEAIINKMNDGIIGLNDKHEILFFNSVAEHLFGLQEKELRGKYAPDVALQNDLLRIVLRNDLQSDPGRQLKIFVDNKESFFAQESILIHTDQAVGGRVIILRNVTPFKELDVAKTNFIATISHELKTPLFAIKMSTQLLDDKRIGELNHDQAELLNSLKDNTERLLKITGELLNMSQVETGHIQLKKAPAQPDSIASRAIEATRMQAGQSHITIREDLEAGLPLIELDEEKTIWVLINFLTNAIKYTPEEGVIRVRIKKEGNDILFSVIDKGRGIEEKYTAHVFDKYFKVPGSTEGGGTGLGLSISKEFIEAQGGKIWVESEYGSGSTFNFSFPVNPGV